jgi:predicted ATPase
MLQHELGRLVEAEIVYKRGVPPQATYIFKHALIQDAAYESLLKSTRQHYHQRIAQVMEAQFPKTAEAQPELLAHHATEAGLTEKAVEYWHQAGQRAADRSAHVEAISHLTKGVELLETLSETPARTQREIMMYLMLGSSLITTKGYASPEVERVYTRAWSLHQHVEETPHLVSVLFGLRRLYLHRGQVQRARELAEQILRLAQQSSDQALLLEAHIGLGAVLYYPGEFVTARTHLETSLTLYTSARRQSYTLLYGLNPGVTAQSHNARVLWLLGLPAQALQSVREALRLAQELSHPYSQAFARYFAAVVHCFRREEQTVRNLSNRMRTFATEQGFPFIVASGTIFQGWSLAMQGHITDGIRQIHQGLTALQAVEEELERLWFLTLLAEVYGKSGEVEEGLQVLGAALTRADQNGDRWWAAEMHRLQGELLLSRAPSDSAEAEASFHHALDIARTQQGKSLELRAATSLSRLWQQQGKRQEAHDLLAPVYNWFTEGFDTADLKDAKALLDELA